MESTAIKSRLLAVTMLLITTLTIAGCSQQRRENEQEKIIAAAPNAANPILAFGSCLRQWQPQPVWQGIVDLKPAAFIFSGDNVYTDVGAYARQPEPERIAQAYEDLANAPDYRKFRQYAQHNAMPIYATWDDHDYGKNDGGAEYPHKLASKQAFLNFFDLEKTASGGAHEAGIYHSDILLIGDLRVQLLLLDTRSFRSPLRKSANKSDCPPTGTVANTDPQATILGSEQWQWLEHELQQAADVRLVVSGIQVIPTEHCFEKWANFPHERQKLFALLKKTAANGVIFISGDRHLAEISLLPASAKTETPDYPLYEITASGLNSAMGLLALARQETNSYRAHSSNVSADNFGAIEFVGQGENTELRLQIRNAQARIVQQSIVKLDKLKTEGR